MPNLADFCKKPDFGLLALRVMLGALLTLHGVGYLMGGSVAYGLLGSAVGLFGMNIMHLFWGFLAALIYTVGGLFIMLGFVFRLVCFLMSLCMFVYAYPYFQNGTLLKPVTPHALTLLILAVCFIFIGPGTYSIDKE